MLPCGRVTWARFKAICVITVSAVALGAAGYGVRTAMRSPLFLIRVVEVADLPDHSPVNAKEVADLAAIPIGQVNLFDLDLSVIEKRVLSHPWVSSVHIQKRLPQTVSITAVPRQAKALLQGEKGELAYVDQEGTVFGKVNLEGVTDLPLLTGLSREKEHRGRILESLALIDLWGRLQLQDQAQISSVSFDPDRGFRLLVAYPAGKTLVDVGPTIGPESEAQLKRLQQVFKYLTENSVAVRHIWADIHKKVVVKIVRRS
jgi:hypothetical protein